MVGHLVCLPVRLLFNQFTAAAAAAVLVGLPQLYYNSERSTGTEPKDPEVSILTVSTLGVAIYVMSNFDAACQLII